MLARNKGVRATIYMTRLTAPAIDWGATPPARLEPFQAGSRFQIGDIEVQSFSIPHDAIDPVGFCFQAQGVRIGVATDLGYVPESIKFHLRRTNVLLLEANHDLDMLKVGPYPWSVKQRVMSRVGHLSNLHVSDYLMQDLAPCTANLILGHLSEQNNHPAIVRLVAAEALERRGLGDASVDCRANALQAKFFNSKIIMIPRYTRPEMGRIWSDQNKFQQWLEVELAASEALARAGRGARRGGAPAARARGLRRGAHPRDRKRGEARRDRLHHRGRRDHGRRAGTARRRAGCITG